MHFQLSQNSPFIKCLSNISMKHFTLYQLHKSLQKLIAGIGQDFWITAEVAQLNTPDHYYLELVQKESEKIVAKARAVVWANTISYIEQKIAEPLAPILRQGNRVLVNVTVSFHEVYGLSLVINEVDIAYTIGELALKRLAVIEKLRQNGLFTKQQQLPIPLVAQRIAVISSADAAGYTDFITHLYQNPSHYRFEVTLFEAGVQGERALIDIPFQISQINAADFDVIVLIRGGGSKLDLLAFDEYAVAEAIALSPLPIFTGIGHQRDETVSDMVAALALKTPTAVANLLIDKMDNFYSSLSQSWQSIHLTVKEKITFEHHKIAQYRNTLQIKTRQTIENERWQIQNTKKTLGRELEFTISNAKQVLKALAKQITLLSPEQIFARGYTYTTLQGLPISKVVLKKGDIIITHSATQKVQSQISGIE